MRKLFGTKSGKKTGIRSGTNQGNKTGGKPDNEPGNNPGTESGKKPEANYTATTERKPDTVVKQNKKRNRPLRRGHIIYASLAIVGVFFAAAALRVIFGDLLEDASAYSEYEQLSDIFHNPGRQTQNLNPTPAANNTYLDPLEDDAEGVDDLRALTMDELAALNRDFKGWMTIGSIIDYPVVRGNDNSKYLNTTFMGSRNTAGAIFMDYRHINGFDEQVCIIYGHNTRDGSMFSPLVRYLEPAFLQSNPNISITTRDGRKLTYRIFAATLTDAWDIAYTVGLSDSGRANEVFPNAPQNASRFLLLSTCTRGGSDDERVLVFAALV